MRAVKGNLDHSLNKCLKQGGMQFDGRNRGSTSHLCLASLASPTCLAPLADGINQEELDDLHESDENAPQVFWFRIDRGKKHRACNYSDSDQAGRGWTADRTDPLDCRRVFAVRWTGCEPMQKKCYADPHKKPS